MCDRVRPPERTEDRPPVRVDLDDPELDMGRPARGREEADGPVRETVRMGVRERRQRGHGVHDEQCGVTEPVHHRTQLGKTAGDAGGRLVVDDDDRLDVVLAIRGQPRLEIVWSSAAAPRARHVVDHQAQALGHLPPGDVREPAGLHDHHSIAGRQRVGQRRLARAGARRRVDDDGRRRLEDCAHAVEHGTPQVRKLRPAMIDDRRIHRPQYAVGNVRRAWNLQEMTTRTSHCASGAAI